MTLPKPITLGRAWDLIDSCIPTIESICPDSAHAHAGGRYPARRADRFIHHPGCLCCRPASAFDALASSSLLPVLSRSERRIVITHRNVPIEIAVSASEDYGSVLFQSTGSSLHVRQIESRRTINQPYPTEDALYSATNLPFIVPELRQVPARSRPRKQVNCRCSSAVADTWRPPHAHDATATGATPVEDMVSGCHAARLRVHGDHRSLVRRSRVDEHSTRERSPSSVTTSIGCGSGVPGMTILHGIEVDILTDGRLDFDDDTSGAVRYRAGITPRR